MRTHTNLLFAGLAMLLAGGANAACSTAKLGGTWDFTFHEIAGVGYCQGLKFTKRGVLKKNAGDCVVHDENDRDKVVDTAFSPNGGALKINAKCSLNTAKDRFLNFKVGSENVKLKVNSVRMSRDGTAMIMYTTDATGRNRYSHVWHGIKQ